MHARSWEKERYSERLKRSRQRAGITQHALAIRLGVKQFNVSRIEKGAKPREPLLSAVLAFIAESERSPEINVEIIAQAVAESDELRGLIRRILAERVHN